MGYRACEGAVFSGPVVRCSRDQKASSIVLALMCRRHSSRILLIGWLRFLPGRLIFWQAIARVFDAHLRTGICIPSP